MLIRERKEKGKLIHIIFFLVEVEEKGLIKSISLNESTKFNSENCIKATTAFSWDYIKCPK